MPTSGQLLLQTCVSILIFVVTIATTIEYSVTFQLSESSNGAHERRHSCK
jgi:hypothetical protein